MKKSIGGESLFLPTRISRYPLEAGVDEVGRGCLAGPVVAAAIILPEDFKVKGLTDSKKLTAQQRQLFLQIIKEEALAYAIGVVSAPEIDSINILQATFVAMNKAVENLAIRPEYIVVDGNRFLPSPLNATIPYQTLIKGDAYLASIAAASILAKEYRDQLMKDLSISYPQYDWENNVGYGTPKHLNAIARYGLTPYHRRSFAPCQKGLQEGQERRQSLPL